MSSPSNQKHAHVALLPSAGMGHLTPFFRLAASLTVQDVQVTFITPHPTVSLAESEALSHLSIAFPQITQLQLHLLPPDNRPTTTTEDPFHGHYEVIRHSCSLLSPLLSSLSPPLSALVTDMSLVSATMPITEALGIPNYVFFTTSAKMLMLFLSSHTIASSESMSDSNKMDVIEIPGPELIPRSSIPPLLLENTNNSLKTYFLENSEKMVESSGILVNTFETLEQESLKKLNAGKVIESLPSVLAIGPLPPCDFEKSKPLAWLQSQPAESVLYVSFGSRTAMSREQLRELGDGLVRSGSTFLWVVKDKKVDREDGEELVQVLGHELMERLTGKGLVVKHWLNQEDILGHPAVGGFLSHCGWNSVTEAVWHAVPILAWPQHGDQKINAGIIEQIGVGTWVKSWGWLGERIVSGTDIAEKIKEIMGNAAMRVQATCIREEARRAVEIGGSSKKGLTELIDIWKNSDCI